MMIIHDRPHEGHKNFIFGVDGIIGIKYEKLYTDH